MNDAHAIHSPGGDTDRAKEVADLRGGPGALWELAARVAQRVSRERIPEANLPWRRALNGEHVEDCDVSVAAPGEPTRPPERRDLPPHLQSVLTRLCEGRTTAEISADLNLTVPTTRIYIKRLRSRLGARSRAELTTRALELGLHRRPIVSRQCHA